MSVGLDPEIGEERYEFFSSVSVPDSQNEETETEEE